VSPEPAAAFLDLRCLQDADYVQRGIGFHVASLVRHGAERYADRLRLVGLVQDGGVPLPAEVRRCLAAVRPGFNPPLPGGSLFVSASPMTHDPSAVARFLRHPRVLSAAIVYDFIPLDYPGYLATRAAELSYCSRLAWLALHDRFLPISRYTARRLESICRIASRRVTVTGACVRAAFFPDAPVAAPEPGRRYVLVVGGEERRKNVEVVLDAMARLGDRAGPVTLRIVGKYSDGARARLREARPRPELVQEIGDDDLAALYRGAAVTVAPSRIEGFSLPVAEASGCGCPVLVSDCDAHRELVRDEDAFFRPDDAAGLAVLLERVLSDETYRLRLATRQSAVAGHFREDRVADRFWSGLLAAYDERPARAAAATPSRGRRPSVAVLTPYPPLETGVAAFSRGTVESLRKLCDVDVFALEPGPDQPVRSARRPMAGPLVRPYDAVISVLGNSRYHRAAFDFFEMYGGPAILHDARLLYWYRYRLDDAAFLAMAREALGRSVDLEDVRRWCADENTSPASFLHEIARRADPLIVHTRSQQERIEREYGARAFFVPPAPIETFAEVELSEASRAAARGRLGVAPGATLLASFGIVHRDKGWPQCLHALRRLRAGGTPAVLHFVGPCTADLEELRDLAWSLGVADHVRAGPEFRTRAEYRDFLLASDLAIQLRTYERGQYSAALADCISAGLPAVATAELADAVDAPAYVRRTSASADASALAGEMGESLEASRGAGRLSAERTAFLADHRFDRYAEHLLDCLGFT
jgi:glycosyltransferase involved in cell wall biosynthesis